MSAWVLASLVPTVGGVSQGLALSSNFIQWFNEKFEASLTAEFEAWFGG